MDTRDKQVSYDSELLCFQKSGHMFCLGTCFVFIITTETIGQKQLAGLCHAMMCAQHKPCYCKMRQYLDDAIELNVDFKETGKVRDINSEQNN